VSNRDRNQRLGNAKPAVLVPGSFAMSIRRPSKNESSSFMCRSRFFSMRILDNPPRPRCDPLSSKGRGATIENFSSLRIAQGVSAMKPYS